jgi:uncharacterized protein YndB with AHSA1/START domain
MELGTIARELFINASLETVFDVVSKPEHIQEWWPDEAHFDAVAGSDGEILFGDPANGGKTVALTVVDVDRPQRFSFHWTHAADEVAGPGNSLLVVFELIPQDDGTLLRFSETGFREMGWDAAVLQETYRDHVKGWDHFLPQLAPYAESLRAAS